MTTFQCHNKSESIVDAILKRQVMKGIFIIHISSFAFRSIIPRATKLRADVQPVPPE